MMAQIFTCLMVVHAILLSQLCMATDYHGTGRQRLGLYHIASKTFSPTTITLSNAEPSRDAYQVFLGPDPVVVVNGNKEPAPLQKRQIPSDPTTITVTNAVTATGKPLTTGMGSPTSSAAPGKNGLSSGVIAAIVVVVIVGVVGIAAGLLLYWKKRKDGGKRAFPQLAYLYSPNPPVYTANAWGAERAESTERAERAERVELASETGMQESTISYEAPGEPVPVPKDWPVRGELDGGTIHPKQTVGDAF